MGKLHQLGKVIITVYANDHLPPHFHAVGPDDEALIEIKTLSILAGSLSFKMERQVMKWATGHKADLAAEWNRINPVSRSLERSSAMETGRTTPRIQTVTTTGPSSIGVKWRGGASDHVDLAGWIASGGAVLASLKDYAVFKNPRVANYGTAVMWGDEDSDVAIDAVHLELLAREQHPFGPEDAASWQRAMELSNHEAADFLRVSRSTWTAYKAGRTPIPGVVAMLCRATARDPILIHAHFRPRLAGRPRKTA